MSITSTRKSFRTPVLIMTRIPLVYTQQRTGSSGARRPFLCAVKTLYISTRVLGSDTRTRKIEVSAFRPGVLGDLDIAYT